MRSAIASFVSLGQLYKAYDRAAETLSSSLGVPLCIPNCGICCNNVVQSYGVEVSYSISVLTGNGKIKDMLSRAEGWLLERHKETPTYEPVIAGNATEQWYRVREESFALGKTLCPFLDSNKRCLLYECRPLPCRAFGVTTAPLGCPRPLGKNEVAGRKAYMGGKAAEQLKAGLTEILDNVPKATWAMSGFFPSMLYAFAKPSEYRRMADRGLIATAKMLITSPSSGLLWQEQIEAMWKEPSMELAPI